MYKSLDFYHFATTGTLFLDNSFLEQDEKLMKEGSFFGFDNIINESTFFEIHSDNLRDSIVSVKSHCINRIRQLIASLSLFHNLDPATSLEEIIIHQYKGKRILLLENNSFFASIFSMICQKNSIQLFTSEYFGGNYKSGDIVNTVLHIDIQNTHFPDEYFDLIIHTDVFEHVPDAPKGEQETVRILKPGGCAIFTVPFDYSAHKDHLYAEIINGEIKYHKDPIYHHDPISPDGKCLVFRIFAFPSTKQRFNALGCDFYCNYLHSRYLGILGNNAYCFVAVKR
jgi:Methyltransferase domain